jgi:pyruvate dehydrogenase E2 component (dihydrolipoamide acetyltransferase)
VATIEFKLPDIGEGVAEGEIVKWLVSAGQAVEEHQAVVEVMTDKATVEIPAPAKGTITELSAQPGDVVAVGSVLFRLETGAGGAAAAPKQAPKEAPARPAPAPTAPARPQQPAQAPAKAPSAPAKAAPAGGGGARIEFRLPDIGEGIAEGEVTKWLVEAGQSVAEHQGVLEVMTDKATVEIPAPAAGQIVEQRVKAGDVVPVGAVLFVLQTAGAPAAPPPAQVAAPAPAMPAARKAAPAPVPAMATSAPAAQAGAVSARAPADKVLAVPSARRVARDLGIDLAQVPGSGRHGVVRRADVESFAQGRPAVAPAAPAQAAPAPRAQPAATPAPAQPAPPRPVVQLAPTERETRTPFRGVRRKIAEAMTRSKFTAPHFTVVEELDVTELVRLREQAKAIAAEQGLKLTYMPFIMKAVASTLLGKHPELNAKLDEATQEIVTYHTIDLGIATDTPQGLIVPVIRGVEHKGLLQLAAELGDLAERTRTGKARPEELKGSTFSITNAGNIGGTLATPIINFPEVAILGVHRIVKRPGVVETAQGDKIEVRQYMNLSMSVDHRIVDGASAARFLVHMQRLLENPGLLAL